MMNPRHIPGLALVCALLLTLPARAASLTHGAYAEAEVRNSAGAHAHHADPGDGRIRWAGAGARADIGAFVSTSTELQPLAASAEARVKAERGQVDMLVLTTQTGSLLGAWAGSSVLAAGYFRFETLVLGAPGSSGHVFIDGSFAASVAPSVGPMPSEALLSFNAYADSVSPGSATCLSASCQAQDTLSVHLQDGDSLPGPLQQPFRLGIDVKAGDTLRLVFSVGARVAGGYFLAIGADLDGAQAARQAAVSPATTAPSTGFGAILLSEGLNLAPVEGLVQLDDGSYGFASPVPEPASAALLLAGLALLAGMRRWRRPGVALKRVRAWQCQGALCGLLLLAGAGTTAAQAEPGLRYGSSAEAWAQLSGQARVRHLDPADQPIRWTRSGMSYASTTAADSRSDGRGGLLSGNAAASVGVHSGRVDALLLSTQNLGADPVSDWALSSAVVGGLIELDTLVQGAPGSSGRLSVVGSFSAAVAAGLGPRSGAELGFSVGVQSFAPAQSGCLLAACRAGANFNVQLSGGQSLPGSLYQRFVLDIDVKAGDRLTLSFIAAARATGGYVLTLGDGQAAGDAAQAGRLAAATSDPGGVTGLYLSTGLALSPVAGLALRSDGSYGFASPVPEPASGLLFGLGLLPLMWRRWHHGRP